MENSAILEVRGLKKSYGRVEAVKGVDFKITSGHCFGLLGPNGAGKTTTLEMIEGIVAPDFGQIFFKNKLVDSDFKQRSGIQFQSTALPDFLRVNEVLKLFQSFYKKKLPLEQIIELCNLSQILDRDCNLLSGGQRQRVLLGIALVNDPDILFLDEPTTGLDPQARRDFWDLILSIKNKGKTVVLTTHYMEEASVLCDDIAIMDLGKILVKDSPKNLIFSQFGDHTHTLEDVFIKITGKSLKDDIQNSESA